MKLLLLLIVPAAIGVIPRLFPRDPSAQPDSRKDVRLDTEERVAVRSFYMHFNFFFSYIQRYTYLHNITSFAIIIIITELNLKHT